MGMAGLGPLTLTVMLENSDLSRYATSKWPLASIRRLPRFWRGFSQMLFLTISGKYQ
jgi:hypothetical protein